MKALLKTLFISIILTFLPIFFFLVFLLCPSIFLPVYLYTKTGGGGGGVVVVVVNAEDVRDTNGLTLSLDNSNTDKKICNRRRWSPPPVLSKVGQKKRFWRQVYQTWLRANSIVRAKQASKLCILRAFLGDCVLHPALQLKLQRCTRYPVLKTG